mmetsp:Transcript_24257/g.37424  ORF Transcript_24257/g.37424 Transcript_24257/m.37424 type:complete len:86 (-) Transcript_24257:112-369(-)
MKHFLSEWMTVTEIVRDWEALLSNFSNQTSIIDSTSIVEPHPSVDTDLSDGTDTFKKLGCAMVWTPNALCFRTDRTTNLHVRAQM